MIEYINPSSENFSFIIKEKSGTTLFTGSVFKTEELLKKKVLFFKEQKQIIFERATNAQGRFLFKVKDSSGMLLGKSVSYHSKVGMENGIKNLLKTFAI